MRNVNRVTPKLPASHTKTYEIAAPKDTHFRKASCAEVACRVQALGFKIMADESTKMGQRQAHLISTSGRAFTKRYEAGLTVFEFAPGTECFDVHQVRLDRPEFYLVRGGDWRGNPRGIDTRQHDRPENWVEDFADHQESLIRGSE